MSAGDQRGQHSVDNGLLPDDAFGHFVTQALKVVAKFGQPITQLVVNGLRHKNLAPKKCVNDQAKEPSSICSGGISDRSNMTSKKI